MINHLPNSLVEWSNSQIDLICCRHRPKLVENDRVSQRLQRVCLVDVNNATCQQVTTPLSDKSFRLEAELPPAHDHLTVTAVLDGGECLDFPATMVYTKSDQSVMLPYHNNPSFCANEPGECVFECDCSAMQCQPVFLIILSAPQRAAEVV